MKIIDSGIDTATNNMNLDKDLLDSIDKVNSPIMHFYEWKNQSATYGCLVNKEKLFNIGNIKNNNLDIAKRPTGGGVIFHIWDFAFSFLLPSRLCSKNTLENYSLVNKIVSKAITSLFNINCSLFKENTERNIYARFCMANSTKYDLVLNGKKVVGAAQRRTKKGMLHQGTISLVKPEIDILNYFLNSKDVVENIFENSFCLLDIFDKKINNTSKLFFEIKIELKKKLKEYFCDIFD